MSDRREYPPFIFLGHKYTGDKLKEYIGSYYYNPSVR